MSVVVRFAPSPTGFLHIGGARTALFNWLYARHHGGTFRLRIEDTDRVRSTPEAVAAIIDGLAWLGLDWDGEIVHQFAGAARHAKVARELLARGRAYHCYCTPEELEAMRAQARAEKRSVHIESPWRDRDPSEAPPGIAPVIRLKAPQEGATTIHDLVQGEVTVQNSELDDLIILRADGTPTYNLSVVVDDYDMGITHVIRGDDHLNNAFRQTQIYRALDWPVPEFAHVPLIHDESGKKMSKRRGTVAVDAYRDMGYLPEALRNYLMRLGWSHGDDEIISTEDAIRWFDIKDTPLAEAAQKPVELRDLLNRPMSDFPDTRGTSPGHLGRSPARFDFAKLDSINAHYMQSLPDERLVELVAPFLIKMLGHMISGADRLRLKKAMRSLKPRAKNLVQLAERARFYVEWRPIPFDDHAAALVAHDRGDLPAIEPSPGSQSQPPMPSAERLLIQVTSILEGIAPKDWPSGGELTHSRFSKPLREFAKQKGVSFGVIAQLLRAALTGSLTSPGIFEVMEVLGREETLGRLRDAASAQGAE